MKEFFSHWIVKNLLIAVCIIIALIIGANFILKLVTNHNQKIVVPDLTNMSVGRASALAAKSNMTIEVTDSIYVKRMARGAVYRQIPKSGTMVKSGRRIALTINAVQEKKVTMPNLIGLSMRQAKAELLSRGLMIGKLIYKEDMATNNVLEQKYKKRNIASGSKIDSESAIDLVLGLNSTDNITYAPLALGLKYLNAIDAVHDNYMNISNVVFDKTVKTYADSLNAVVYRQSPAVTERAYPMGIGMSLYLTLDTNKVPNIEELLKNE